MAASLGSGIVTPFLATMNASDFRTDPQSLMHSAKELGLNPPERISQVPRHIFHCALLPITPGRSASANARFFEADIGLHHLWQADHDQMCNGAESNAAHGFARPGFDASVTEDAAGSATCRTSN